MALCKKAQKEFHAFVQIDGVPHGQLIGGKLCAALDRQHPRDIFDVEEQLKVEGLTDDIMCGFLFCLLSSNRPMHELLQPHLKDQRQTLVNQFAGMTSEPFTYENFEHVRNELIKSINSKLTDVDKQFLKSVMELNPAWTTYDFKDYPSIQWKLQNLARYKVENETAYNDALEKLIRVLGDYE